AYGVPPGALARATAIARTCGVRPEQALMADGMVSEQRYYSALARHLGLRYVAGEVLLDAGTKFPQSILTGFAPLPCGDAGAGDASAGPAWLVAPQDRRIDELFTLRHRGTLPVERFAIATPEHLRALVMAHDGQKAADISANALCSRRPDLSARSAMPVWMKAVLAAAVLLLMLLAGAGAGRLFWLVWSLFAGAVFSGSIVLRLFAAAGSFDPLSREELLLRRTKAPRIPDCNLPHYTIVAALYREAASAQQLAAALRRIDYPAAKLQIIIVLEEDDSETRQAFEALDLPARFQFVVLPDGRPRTKPRGLNAALALARGEYICVFDAEDIPGRLQLREAVAVFDACEPDVACVQARLTIDNRNESWLARLFAIEYAALFDVINPGLAWMRMPMLLGGTSNHFSTSVLRALYGWDAWNVTEDADLGLRLARFGYRVEVLASSTREEAPVTAGQWMRQRRRWVKGWMQTLLVHLRHPRQVLGELGVLRSIIAFLQVGGGILGFLLGPVFAVVTTSLIFWGDMLRPATTLGIVVSTCWCFVFLAGLISAFWPLWLGLQRRRLLAQAPWLLTMPAYWLLQTIAAWWALADLLRDPFHWHKTEHGLTGTP
ncbi:MAG: glycosyltransferase, partial [Hyphomicrobiales bacterium]|nr:glycosyltransferase [Hyphomicrobiales bacterium]